MAKPVCPLLDYTLTFELVGEDVNCTHMVCILLPLLSFIHHMLVGLGGSWWSIPPKETPGKDFIRNMYHDGLSAHVGKLTDGSIFVIHYGAISTPPVCRCPEDIVP